MRKHSVSFVAFLAVFLVALQTVVAYAGNDLPSAPGGPTVNAVVVRIVDGDTIRVNVGAGEIPVRLIGIDTPESRNNARAQKQAKTESMTQKEIVRLGKLATRHLQSLVRRGDVVTLEFDIEKNDRYGRTLAYVWLRGKMLNASMVADGYAYPLTIPPNIRYAEVFTELFRSAREYGAGLWGENQ